MVPGPERDRLVSETLGLARKLAVQVTQACNRRLTDDALGDAYEGLVDAANRFEPRGSSFKTYAAARIRGAVVDGMRRDQWFPNSRHFEERRQGPMSFEALRVVTDDDDDVDFVEVLEDPDTPERVLEPGWDAEALWQAVARADLTDQERRVLRLNFWEGWTLNRIGALYGVTESRACQISRAAQRKVQRQLALTGGRRWR
jgi:RNA polymerase sigma factor for flagellar operon FliA